MEPPRVAPDDPARVGAAPRGGFLLLLAGLVVSGVAMTLARFPGVVERAYGSTVGPFIARSLSLLTGWTSLSIGAVLLAALACTAAWKSVRAIRRIRAGEPARRVLLEGANGAAGVLGILLIAFYVTWGLNYARAPLGERLELVDSGPADAEELGRLTALAVERTNEAYRRLHHGRDDVGVPTAELAGPAQVSRALQVGWRRVTPELGLGSIAADAYGPVKTLGVTGILDFLDIAGMYVPFTGEALVSAAQPDLSFPAVAAHEQAHQRGVARENEATFAGVLAAIHADDPWARYSGWARILRALQSDLAQADPEAWRRASASLSRGVIRDWRDYIEWLRESRGPAAPIVTATNDAYLRAHGVPGGIESYGRVTTLLLAWAQRYGGLLDAAYLEGSVGSSRAKPSSVSPGLGSNRLSRVATVTVPLSDMVNSGRASGP